MIEKLEKTYMDAETDVVTVGEHLDSHKYSITAKSLIEDDDEEDEEHLRSISRNPSLVDSDENLQHHASEENERNGPSDLNAIIEQDDAVTSERLNLCALPEVNPLCQHGLPLLPGCQVQTLAEQIDYVTQCRAFDIFIGFHDDSYEQEQEAVDQKLLPGMYSIPRKCEYCGADDTDDCASDCQRPKSFFRKKRPPFIPPNSSQWDPVTAFEAATPGHPASREDTVGEPQDLQEVRQTFLMGLGELFRTPRGPAEHHP